MTAPKAPPAWTAAFLEALARTGVVKLAAEAAGVSARGASKRRVRDATFAQAWDTAIRAHRAEHAQRLLSAEAERALVARPSPSGAVLQRAGQSRWTKTAEEKFLIELTVSGNVRRAASAAGFTTVTAYKQRMKDRHFAAAWDAAIETGKARVQGYLVEAATRTFDPDELPIGEELDEATVRGTDARAQLPKVSISEAISIARLNPSTGSGRAGRKSEDDDFDGWPITREEYEAAKHRIVDRLQRIEEEEHESGRCHFCGQPLPLTGFGSLTLHGFSA